MRFDSAVPSSIGKISINLSLFYFIPYRSTLDNGRVMLASRTRLLCKPHSTTTITVRSRLFLSPSPPFRPRPRPRPYSSTSHHSSSSLPWKYALVPVLLGLGGTSSLLFLSPLSLGSCQCVFCFLPFLSIVSLQSPICSTLCPSTFFPCSPLQTTTFSSQIFLHDVAPAAERSRGDEYTSNATRIVQ